ncbi:hypothetical protein SynSYN20_01586 [Synechococcus sp. SYN20]|uniref:hypothetical protein n=1 Tax=Synechococcus sp. SYN20 TaxID=1050714 RepID=UPI0016474452|nr:hypothetical protein [Synechococcus sp. SYN20]QNJ25913.1 hypothetical protein SynSYN20_01586 [Synechococcus sp. SYN20]
MKALLLVSAGLLLGAPAMALEVGVRHSHGSSYSTFEGRSVTDSHVNGSVTEHSVSGGGARLFGGSGGFRTVTENYGSTTNTRERFSGGANSGFTESATFSR